MWILLGSCHRKQLIIIEFCPSESIYSSTDWSSAATRTNAIPDKYQNALIMVIGTLRDTEFLVFSRTNGSVHVFTVPSFWIRLSILMPLASAFGHVVSVFLRFLTSKCQAYDPSCIFPTDMMISDSLCPCQRRTSGRIRERGAWVRVLRLGRLCGNGLVKPVQAAGNAM